MTCGTRGDRSWPLAVGAGLVVLLAAGCRDTRVEEEKSTAAFERMEAIGAAYRKATARRGSPPRSAADLRAFCPQGMSPEEFLVSPGDGEPVTVFWGADPSSGMDVNPLVLAHERTGGRRGRLVLTSMGVLQMPAEVFAKARFPAAAPPAAEAAR